MKSLRWILYSIIFTFFLYICFIDTETQAKQKLGQVLDKITIDAEVRVRPEFRKDLTQTVPAVPGPNEEDFSVLLRTRLGLRFDMTDHIGIYLQLQDAREFGEEAAAIPNTANDDEGFDLHQGYLDFLNIGRSDFNFRIGRQEINLGDQRLVGAVNWSNVGRSFDGALLTYDGDNFLVSVLATMPNKTAFGDQIWFGGIYNTWKNFPSGVLDVYYFILQDNDGATGNPAGTGDTQSVHTVGARIKSTPGNWDFGFEGAGQIGKFGSNSIFAYAGHAKAGYTWKDTHVKPRLGIEGNIASGDDGANNRFTRFNNLFPTNHNKYGFMDLAAWSNLMDASASVSIKPGNWKAAVEYHLLAVMKSQDPFGFAGIAGSAGRRKLGGHEVDVTVGYTINKYANLLAGYSFLIPGGFLKDVGINSWSHFAYLQAIASF